MKDMLKAIAFIICIGVLLYCSEESNVITTEDPLFASEIQPLLNSKCISCHGELNPANGLRLDSWERIVAGSDFSEALIPYDPENSLLYEILSKLQVAHITAEDSLTESELDLIFNWISDGAVNDEGDVPHENTSNRIYVCNQGSGMVSAISAENNHVIRNIKFEDLGFSDNSKPHDITTDQDGNWYVSLIGDGKILKFDKDYNLLGQVDFPTAGLLAINEANSLLYAGHTLSTPDVPQTLAVIDYDQMSIQEISLPYARPHALATGNNTDFIFNFSLVNNRISVIDANSDPENLKNVQILPGSGRTIVQINVAPDNNSAVISSQLDQKLLILDISNADAITVSDSIVVGQHPWHPKFSVDGSKIFVGNNISNTISVVSTSSYEETNVIGIGDGSDGLARPHGLIVSAAGQRIYITNRNTEGAYKPRYDFGDNSLSGTVVVINVLSNQIENIIELEKFPSGLAQSIIPAE